MLYKIAKLYLQATHRLYWIASDYIDKVDELNATEYPVKIDLYKPPEDNPWKIKKL